MDTNDLNRRLRYSLQLDDADALRLIKLGGEHATLDEISAWRLKDDHPDCQVCPEIMLSALLGGLILEHRGPPANGPSDGAPNVKPGVDNKPRAAMDNNAVIKGIKTALSLRSQDVQALIVSGGGSVSNSEVSSLLRRPDARNFRRCGDQMLRRFLTGLAERQRNNTPDTSA